MNSERTYVKRIIRQFGTFINLATNLKYMNLKAFFTKNWQHIAAIAFIFILAAVFFKPQFDGLALDQHDIKQWKGMAHETEEYRSQTGEEPLWTNAMFGGMPTTQISVIYPGNFFKECYYVYFRYFPAPFGVLLLHLIGFYIFALFLRINPIIGLIGAVALSFASYEVIIMQAGHLTKSIAAVFLAPALGAFIYTYRSKSIWGVLWLTLFMTMELVSNHLQVTYYFGFVLVAVGIYFLVRAIKEKELKAFSITTGGIVAGFLLAGMINYGNIALTNDYAKHTIRGGNDVTITSTGEKAMTNSRGGLDKDYITNWSYGIGETFTLISPNVKGGGSFALGGSQFEDLVIDSDFTSKEKNELLRLPAYWGDQPMTSGPVYLGVIILFLAFLGMIFMKSKIKWPLFAVTVLAVMLSWGKNFMGLTDFFINYVPGYNKFRTVTIILMIVELSIVVLGILFLSELFKNRERFKEKKKQFAIAIGGFFIFLLLVKFVGLGDGYSSEGDRKQLESIAKSIEGQLAGMDPTDLQKNYGIDMSNRQQVDSFIDQQMEAYEESFDNLKSIRKEIFHSSMNRTLAFAFFGGVLLVLFAVTAIPSYALGLGLLLLTLIDVVPVSYQYIGDEERYWADAQLMQYPMTPSAADEQILENEIANNPGLASKIEKAAKKAGVDADEKELEGSARRNFIDSKRFYALNMATNYRVFDLSGGFNSSETAYFHKSLGGYHGAKLRNINNLMDFHLSTMNTKVYDMLNVKYFLQNGQSGVNLIPRQTEKGNAWLVKSIEKYETPDQEILGLGNKVKITNVGNGQLLVNGEPTKEEVVYNSYKLRYVLPSKDTLDIRLRQELKEGTRISLVMDANGKVGEVPQLTIDADTANSFKQLVNYSVENEFKVNEEAVMLASEAKKLKGTQFTGEGSVTMKSYSPNRIEYAADVNGNQFVVFSEIYYPEGWKAFVDGKETPIIKTNYLLRGIEVPNGKHKVEFKFDLEKYHMSNTLAMIGSLVLLLTFLGAGFIYFRNKKRAI